MKKVLCLLLAMAMIVNSGVALALEEILPDMRADDVRIFPFPLTVKTITIREGWNLIAMPVVPSGKYTVRDFIRSIENPFMRIDRPIELQTLTDGEKLETNDKGEDCIIFPRRYWTVSVVAVYKNGKFIRYPKNGHSYNMVPGEAYFVHTRYHGPRPDYTTDVECWPPWHASKIIRVIGKSVNFSVTLNLRRGWNGVSIMREKDPPFPPYPFKPILDPIIRPYDLNDKITDNDQIEENCNPGLPINIDIECTLSQLSKELVKQGLKPRSILFWDSYNQRWQQHALPVKYPIFYHINIKPDKHIAYLDRLISSSEGFFLLVEENGIYEPGLEESLPGVPFPPPPLPPLVRSTGRVQPGLMSSNWPPHAFTHDLRTDLNGDGISEIVHLDGRNNERILEALNEYMEDENNTCLIIGKRVTLHYTDKFGNPHKLEIVSVTEVKRLEKYTLDR